MTWTSTNKQVVIKDKQTTFITVSATQKEEIKDTKDAIKNHKNRLQMLWPKRRVAKRQISSQNSTQKSHILA